MSKFFVVSDIHGFYDEFKAALDEAGFDPENEEHWLIGCGDYLDRGRPPAKVSGYLKRLPRKILIRGNHESLILDCIYRGYPQSHDHSNGTVQTIFDLSDRYPGFDEACLTAYSKLRTFFNSMVDYFETKNYIFVHSWIPLKCNDDLPIYYTRDRDFEFREDWREAHYQEWEAARWGNPFSLAEQGLFPDKTIVFGHWHCSTGWAKEEGREEFGESAKFEPYYGDGFIGIDACTAYTKKVNVLVLEDEFLEEDVCKE